LVEPQAGGWGATADRDGENGLVPVGDGETYIMPVEICETRYPLRVERFTFNLADAGAGKFRGGFGLIREYRILCAGARLTTTFGRHRFPPWGGAGGADGSVNGAAVIRAGEQAPAVWRGKFARYPLGRDDLVRLVTGVGGGYGDPRTRDPLLTAQDVRDELLGPGAARNTYGVILDSDTFK
jgi:N-methylhydantoinase B